MQAKTPANYAAITQAQHLMEQTGSQDAFLIDNQGYVVEATVANFFVVKGDVIMTPPNKGSILPGITRRTIAEILGNSSEMFRKYKKSVRVVEKDITKADLYTADCVFLCGTYAEVVKVSEIDGRKIDGDDFYFKLVQKEYSDLVRGRK
jgi:branched-chain amino acid aminotransferase